MWDKIAEGWCKTMHKHSTWPIHGRYSCRDCGREYTIEWTEPAAAKPRPDAARVTAQVERAGAAIRGTLHTMRQYFRSAIT